MYTLKIGLVLALTSFLISPATAKDVNIDFDSAIEPIRFAADELANSLRGEGHNVSVNASSAESTVALRVARDGSAVTGGFVVRADGVRCEVIGADPAEAMYGGLELAERVRLGRDIFEVGEFSQAPHLKRRGIKFNIPLDLRTPSYSDCSDAAQANIPVMWEREFWTTLLDDLARHRYNVLSLWSLHPFPSMVKVPEFPEVALDDVWRTRMKLDEKFSGLGTDMVKPAMLADHEVVKRITIDEKIEFWRWVMRYAKDRGIDIYIFTWNVFTWGAEGKHGITAEMENPVTKQYFRASIREMVNTYPLLAGFGITAGEAMPHNMASTVKEKWLWETYGEGVRDAKKDDPARTVHMIHRFHWTAQSDIIDAWKDYPGFPATFDFSFKHSVAHMYSIPNPPFVQPLVEGIRPGLRTWLTVRNDDIYTFRFGDPDYIRDYIANMPPADKCVGFYMGPDGFTWGRSFLERNPRPGPRPLMVEKQWYSFMLMGRLAYDPTLSNAHFEQVLGTRFPGLDAHAVFRALQSASQTMPLVTRFFWGDIDVKWYPEACWSHPRYRGFYTVKHFMEGIAMPGADVLSIREWREKLAARQPMGTTTPLQIADALQGAATEALRMVGTLREKAPDPDSEIAATLDDCEALALLGHYYAAKIRGACALAQFDLSRDATEQVAAVRNLESALEFWKRYAAVRDARYVPALYNRVGRVDLTALIANVTADVDMARNWQPGSVNVDAPRAGTEPGFKQ